MSPWITSLLRPVLAAALVGGTLGGLGVLGYFFFANREMCPCAPVGIDGADQLIAVPLTEAFGQSIYVAGLSGAGLGVALALIFILPPALRLNRLARDESPS